MENVVFFGANWVDAAVVVFVIVYFVLRLRTGLVEGFIDSVGFLVSLFCAYFLYPHIGKILVNELSLSRGIGYAIGFIVSAFLVNVLFSLTVAVLKHHIHFHLIDPRVLRINKLLGFVPTAVSAFILLIFFFTILVSLPVRPNIKQDVLQSRIGSYFSKKSLGIENRFSDVFGGAIDEALTFMTVKPGSGESVNLDFQTDDFQVDTSSEAKMLQLLNRERTSRGFSALAEDPETIEVARDHCRDMFARGYFSHNTPDGLTPFDRIEDAGVDYQVAGENLAFSPSVEIAHQGLMNSPGHRANILSPDYGQVAIGVIDAGIYGKMFCQVFRN